MLMLPWPMALATARGVALMKDECNAALLGLLRFEYGSPGRKQGGFTVTIRRNRTVVIEYRISSIVRETERHLTFEEFLRCYRLEGFP